MKLWTVTISDEIVVLAEDADAALRIARRNMSEVNPEADDVEPMDSLPGHWDVDAVPFSDGNKNRTIGQLVEDGMAPEYAAARLRSQKGPRT